MSEYRFTSLEKKWQHIWDKEHAHLALDNTSKPKCYVLDMFPYPSGAGLHVGHPLGYIASDIYARYKRLKGYNVLHPIGYDAFGLPAEQFAIEHGVHPAISTEKNIKNFRQQLKKIGLSFDWERELKTCDPQYYKWTQWIFLKLFNSWYNDKANRVQPIDLLIQEFEKKGNEGHPYEQKNSNKSTLPLLFSTKDWNSWSEEQKNEMLMNYRLAYLAYTDVNWCETLGTVLANDEVINGLSYRGGHPVTKKKMKQWHLRITKYAERLLAGLENIDYSPSLKQIQRNWIGKSIGATIHFSTENSQEKIIVYTTKPHTIFGVDFLVLAPEHPLVAELTSQKEKESVLSYLNYVSQRSEVDRVADSKKMTGCFTGGYALHPFLGKKIPIWIAEYVLVQYGTGAVMAVPCGDARDHAFAKQFQLPISNIWGSHYDGKSAYTEESSTLSNSDFLNTLDSKSAFNKVVQKLSQKKIGEQKINYKMRDAGWSRQRYWGEPFPIVYQNGIVKSIPEEQLPLILPDIEDFQSPGTGEGPLANATKWIHPSEGVQRDSNTMPTHAGAAWYFLRFADPNNAERFADKQKLDYWNQVDVYIGGSEHAVAHLLYARLWTKVLYDLGFLSFDEPFNKLINQGKITGETKFVYRIKKTNQFVTWEKKEEYNVDILRIDINLTSGKSLNIQKFKTWRKDFENATFILNEKGTYTCGTAIEKMSKSYFNVVNPNDVIERYGADTFRMYEMFLGPLEDSKPWDTSSIEGVHRFLKKLWRFVLPSNESVLDETPLNEEELSLLHQTIKKVEHDTLHFSFNTAISCFMSCLNELRKTDCHKRKMIEPLLILLAPYAPHISEELWQKIGNKTSILHVEYPKLKKEFIQNKSVLYAVCINGKKRAEIEAAPDHEEEATKISALNHPNVKKWLSSNPKKTVFVKNKMINFVV